MLKTFVELFAAWGAFLELVEVFVEELVEEDVKNFSGVASMKKKIKISHAL